ncbi:MAG: ABC transporter permease [Actinomycetota bacterium]
MRAALTIAAKDLRQRTRDRSAYVIAFLVPFGLTAIFSLTLAKVSDESKFTATYTVVDRDGGEVARAFEGVVRELDFVKLKSAGTVAEASKLAEDGKIDAAFVIPAGFSAAASAGQGGELRVITSPNSEIGGMIARSIAGSFASEIDAVGLSVQTVLAEGGGSLHDPTTLSRLVERARQATPTALLDQNTAENRLFSSTTFYAVGMAVLFVFFTVQFGVRSLLAERETGTLARLLVAPMRPAWVVAGKALASFAVGIASMIALVLASSLLLGADWGDPIGAALLVVSAVLAAMGITALVATLAKTPAQAEAYVSVVAIVGGMLGGTFFPVSQGPAFLANLSLITPHAWLMRGFQELAGGASALDILPSVGAVLAFAVVLGGIALARADRLAAR